MNKESAPFLRRLFATIRDRESEDPTRSYVASLYAKGTDKILEKIGEEAVEMILARKSGSRAALIHEAADLLFHMMVALAQAEVDFNEIERELERRFGRSGLDRHD